MSGPLGSSQWMYNSGGGFYPTVIDQSLMFDGTAYLSRTPSVAGNRRTWTFSGWVKRSELGTGASNRNSIFGSDDTNSPSLGVIFKFQDDKLDFISSGGGVSRVTSNAVYRDSSAWYHCVLSVDTTQSTASNRAKMYVNGEQITSLANAVYPSQNTDFNINTSSYTMRLGVEEDTSSLTNYLNGYLADTYFIDGTALDPTSFGEFKNGVWIPKAYTGSYGTNGFHLEYDGNANDSSGTGNNWTATNIASTDYMLDSPTNNYAVLNPLDKFSSTIGTSEANLKLISTSGGSFQQIRNSFAMSSGKWYMEWVINSQGTIGRTGASLIRGGASLSGASTSVADAWAYHSAGDAYHNNVTTALSTGAITVGTDVVMYTFDADTGDFWMGKNGVWANSGDPAAGTSPIYSGLTNIPYFFGGWTYNTSDAVTMNFGQSGFTYTPPDGFLALCTANLPEPSISPANGDSPQDHFNTVLYTGDGATTQNVTGVGFQPDFTWIKERSSTSGHVLADSVRGYDKYLVSNETIAEGTGVLNSALSDGFQTTNSGATNQSGQTYVGWNWKASNATAVSNTAGTITSQVSANPTAGFSIVSYTGTGSAATVGHGLSSAPDVLITKARQNGASYWLTYHSGLGNNTHYMALNTAGAVDTGGASVWNSTSPTSSVFSVGTSSWVNPSSGTMIAYCFHSVEGYSKFGSYTGNGSTDGPFVYTGFRPAWVMYKCSSASGDGWSIWDVDRDPINGMDRELIASSSAAEGTATDYIDFVSNGFKIRASGGSINLSGGTFIYMAFAENPFKYSVAR